MGTLFIIQKDDKTSHTYSRRLLEKAIADGWVHLITMSGWNMSITHEVKR